MQRSAASEFLINASILHAAPADTERYTLSEMSEVKSAARSLARTIWLSACIKAMQRKDVQARRSAGATVRLVYDSTHNKCVQRRPRIALLIIARVVGAAPLTHSVRPLPVDSIAQVTEFDYSDRAQDLHGGGITNETGS